MMFCTQENIWNVIRLTVIRAHVNIKLNEEPNLYEQLTSTDINDDSGKICGVKSGFDQWTVCLGTWAKQKSFAGKLLLMTIF